MSLCSMCEAELPDGVHLCWDDTTTLRALLGRARETLGVVGGSFTNQSVGGPSVGGGGAAAGSAAPINLGLLGHVDQYRETMVSWARMCGDYLGHTPPGRDPIVCAAWLDARTDEIRLHDWAGDMVDELWDAERVMLAAVDRYTPRRVYGPCGRVVLTDEGPTTCGGTVAGREGHDRAACDACREPYDAGEYVRQRVMQTRKVALGLADCVRILKARGLPVNYNTAKSWVKRGRLTAVVCDVAARQERYTPADLVEVLTGTMTTGARHGDS